MGVHPFLLPADQRGRPRPLRGHHSAKLLLASVDFHEIEKLQRARAWAEAGDPLAHYDRSLELAGADVLLIGANTMHRVAPAAAAVDFALGAES